MTPFFSGFGNDFRIGWRTLWRTPRLAIIVVLTLALGMSLITTVFSLLNGYLWHAMPYEGADRVISLAEVAERRSPLY